MGEWGRAGERRNGKAAPQQNSNASHVAGNGWREGKKKGALLEGGGRKWGVWREVGKIEEKAWEGEEFAL